MRTIKFRAWHSVGKQMFSAEEMGIDQLTLMPDGKGFVNVSGTSTTLSEFIPEMIPLQYTGLADKNGKEIYEGDVLLDDIGHKEVVEWDECSWQIDNKNLYRRVAERKIVIGNIYENPELILANPTLQETT